MVFYSRRGLVALVAAVIMLLGAAAAGAAMAGQAALELYGAAGTDEAHCDPPAGSDDAALFTTFSTQDTPYFAESSFSQGYARVEHGVYALAVKPRQTRLKSAVDLQRTTYRVETRLAMPRAESGGYAGIMVRSLDHDGSYGISLEIGRDATWRLTADDPFTETEVIVPWTESLAIKAAPAANVISVEVAGRSVAFSANGKPLITYRCHSVGTYIALLAGTSASAGNLLAHFDYIMVHALAEDAD